MSQFSGKQFRGAKRILKEVKREEAEKRNKEFQKKKSVKALLKVEDKLEGTEEGFVS